MTDFDKLQRTAHLLEQDLRLLELSKRKQHKISLTDARALDIRQQLMGTYEDLIILDTNLSKGFEDRSWSVVFYSRIEELRSVIGKFQMERNEALGKALEELEKHLDLGTQFYQTLLLNIQSRFKIDPVSVALEMLPAPPSKKGSGPKTESREMMYAAFCYKVVIYMGDLARYRATYCQRNSKSWELCSKTYEYAAKINPFSGKTFSQLAIVATNRRNFLESLFFYSLSLSSSIPLEIARDNLKMFHAKVSAKESLKNVDSLVIESSNDGFMLFGKLIVQYHCDFLFQTAVELDGVTDYDKALTFQRVIAEALSVAISGEEIPEGMGLLVRRACIILLCGHKELNAMFEANEKAGIRQKIRCIQAVTFAIILDIIQQLLDLITTNLVESVSKLESEPLSSFVASVGLVCMIMELEFDMLVQFKNYTAPKTPLETLNKRLIQFLRSLVTLTNSVSDFADMDGSKDCLEEDVLVMGLKWMDGFRRMLDGASILNVLSDKVAGDVDTTVSRMSRIASFMKEVVESKSFDGVVSFDTKENKFAVIDEESKRLERDKVSKALAVELLKNHIGSLETTIDQVKQRTLPFVVLDVDCYIFKLRFIKSMLMSRRCILIVPLDIIRSLDSLKKENDQRATKAREAIRYLEQRFKYRSKFLRAQQTAEYKELWKKNGFLAVPKSLLHADDSDSLVTCFEDNPPLEDVNNDSQDDDAIPNVTIQIPKSYRSILGCCGYYRDHIAPAPLDEEDRPFTLYTDNPSLVAMAKCVGVPTRSLNPVK
ncbi:Protein smg7 [Chytridiales sp. JEL 0842]|nr:Protein smg7 [Chytridiales sp. JEL 0842]